jgi:two-component system, NarL family, response regulator NreC
MQKFPLKYGESEKPEDILTIREFEILKLIAKGFISKEISLMINLSYFTINTYRKSIQHKLNVKNCAEAVYKATKLKLI